MALQHSTDKSKYSSIATFNLSNNIMLSSSSKLDCYEPDLNLGVGKLDAVRRPPFDPGENLVYLTLKSQQSEIVVAMHLQMQL